ncbi:unnamed protein product, partial [Ectocarpus sp. 12 AP-2014]
GGEALGNRGGVQHPVRARPALVRLLHHRGECSAQQIFGVGLQGHRLPSRVRGGQAGHGHH